MARILVSSDPPPRGPRGPLWGHPFRSLSGHFLVPFYQITLQLLCAVATGGRSGGALPGCTPECTPGIPVSPSTVGPPTTPGTTLFDHFCALFWPLFPENSLFLVCSGYWRQIPDGHPGVHPGCTPGTTLFDPFCALSEPFFPENSLITVCSGYWRQIQGYPLDLGCPGSASSSHCTPRAGVCTHGVCVYVDIYIMDVRLTVAWHPRGVHTPGWVS